MVDVESVVRSNGSAEPERSENLTKTQKQSEHSMSVKPTQVMAGGAIFFITFLAFCSLSFGQGLFQYYEQYLHDLHRAELQKSLGLTLTPDAHGGSLRPEKLEAVKNSIEVMFDSLPKNQAGRISVDVLRYMAHRYFSHKYSWIVKGFEPHHQGSNTSLSDASILRSHVPEYCGKVLKGSLAATGFSLDDAATVLGVVEQLIFDEIVELTESAYSINDFSMNKKLSKKNMFDVVYSFLLEGMLEGNYSDAKRHATDKQNILEIYPNWHAAQLFVEDLVGQDAFEKKQTSSPYTRGAQRMYSFEEVAKLTTQISQEFGPWANYECKTMKESLAKMDVHGTGRVKLSDFWGVKAKGENEEQWHFQENSVYLKALGALDDSDSTLGAQVIIPNYVYSASNCILATSHYSVCCLNECESITAQLESRLRSPEASTSEIVTAVEYLISTSPLHLSIPGGQESLNATLRPRLEEFAAKSGNGLVPIHGRLFAQWLHFAFPRDCPYPHEQGSVNPMTPGEWIEAKGSKEPGADDPSIVLESDLEKLAEQPETLLPPSPRAGVKMWEDKEQLLTSSTASDEWLRTFQRSGAGMLLVTGLLITIIKSIRHMRKVLSKDKTATIQTV